MPMMNNAYVAPMWANDSAPALDAAELQAMSDSIEGSQTLANSVTLTTAWTDAGDDVFTQEVTVSGGTANSKVDLQPSAAQLKALMADGVSALYVENDGGTFTVYAIGAAPTAEMTVQITRTEVAG